MKVFHGWNVGLALVALSLGALTLSVKRAPRTAVEETPSFDAPVPVEAWPTDAGVLPAVRSVLAALPAVPGQKVGGCDPDLGEAEIDGRCWMKTEVPQPCPKGKLYPHEGKCWRPIPRASRAPTSGSPRPGGVAEP